jgi:hypothetical protein
MGFIVFRILLPTVVLLIQFVLYRRTERWLNRTTPQRKSFRYIARALFILFNIAFLYAVMVRPTAQYPVPGFVQWGSYPFFFWHTGCFFVGLFLLISHLVRTPFKLGLWIARKIPATNKRITRLESTTSFQTFDGSRRKFLSRSMYGLTGVAFAGSAYGMLLEKHECDIIPVEFSFPHLPDTLDGFTIGLVSDIHSSIFMPKEEMDRYAALVNSLNADLIVVPGDFVNSDINEVYPFAEAFSVLKAPYGVYGVTGNHDFYAGADFVSKKVDECGIKMLRDDKVVIDKNGGKFYLVGVDDVGFENRAPIKMDAALGSAPLEIPRILLCHRPYYLKQAATRNFDLVLSGHTHGGQVVLGRFGDLVIAPSRLASKYVWGKYHEGNTHMYVTSGIGTVGLPVRINCPPEITKITLRKA